MVEAHIELQLLTESSYIASPSVIPDDITLLEIGKTIDQTNFFL